jgi:hypothetical protein
MVVRGDGLLSKIMAKFSVPDTFPSTIFCHLATFYYRKHKYINFYALCFMIL